MVQVTINTDGDVISREIDVKGGFPLVIVSSMDNKTVVMKIDEVSDDNIVNAFIHTDSEIQSSMLQDESFVGVGNIDKSSPQYEILINYEV